VRPCSWTILILVGAMLALIPRPTSADGEWLSGNLVSWNTPGSVIPAAPGEASVGVPGCESYVRPPETPEDARVAARGWLLYAPYQLAWDVSIVQGTLGFDANCRPVAYQVFVFVGGTFAGTLAPEPMLPRNDGALVDFGLGAEGLSALYDRYAPSDAFCCPFAQTRVRFEVERTQAGPVVIPTQAENLPKPPGGR
jgi:hypothetical protein